MDKSSGVGVLDKAVALLDAIAAHPCSLTDLVAVTDAVVADICA